MKRRVKAAIVALLAAALACSCSAAREPKSYQHGDFVRSGADYGEYEAVHTEARCRVYQETATFDELEAAQKPAVSEYPLPAELLSDNVTLLGVDSSHRLYYLEETLVPAQAGEVSGAGAQPATQSEQTAQGEAAAQTETAALAVSSSLRRFLLVDNKSETLLTLPAGYRLFCHLVSDEYIVYSTRSDDYKLYSRLHLYSLADGSDEAVFEYGSDVLLEGGCAIHCAVAQGKLCFGGASGEVWGTYGIYALYSPYIYNIETKKLEALDFKADKTSGYALPTAGEPRVGYIPMPSGTAEKTAMIESAAKLWRFESAYINAVGGEKPYSLCRDTDISAAVFEGGGGELAGNELVGYRVIEGDRYIPLMVGPSVNEGAGFAANGCAACCVGNWYYDFELAMMVHANFFDAGQITARFASDGALCYLLTDWTYGSSRAVFLDFAL